MEKVLVNSDEYNGQYVAMVSEEDNTIAGSGSTPEEALNEARKEGILNSIKIQQMTAPDRQQCVVFRQIHD